MHIIYDGANGQLPNLDLINSVINIAGGQMGVHSYIQGMRHHTGSYKHRLRTLLRGMFSQSLGNAAGPHSSFIPYHVDAVTLQPSGRGLHDEMAMGRIAEGTFRSLNNLLEHLHQSFFFYLLVQRDRFVSIGTYLPSAMLLAANFTIMAIFLWMKSVQPIEGGPGRAGKEKAKDVNTTSTSGRDLVLPLGIIAACHSLAAIPVYLFNHLPLEVCCPGKPVQAGADTCIGPSCFLCSLCSPIIYAAADHILRYPTTVHTYGPALSADQVLLSAHSWNGPIYTCYTQLLAGFCGWPPGYSTDICEA